MNSDIRLQRTQFDPGQELASNVAKLEQRLVLNSTWKFPPGFVASLPGQKGPFILTSRAYGEAQRMVDKSFANFAGSLAKVQNQLNAGKINFTQAANLIGIAGPGYAPNSLLGRLESQLQAAESRIPYGKGISSSPGGPLGVGLSDASATGANPFNALGTGVTSYLQTNLAAGFGVASNSEIRSLVEWTRQYSLRFKATSDEPAWSWGSYGITSQSSGILPGYLVAFGTAGGGAGYFGTKNT